MNQIMPHALWVGHAGDGRSFHILCDQGIRAVVQLALEEATCQAPREFIYCRFPLLDGSGNDPVLLDLAIRSVASLIHKGVPTLVCCGAGMSRSPAIVAAALALLHQAALEECLKAVVECHPADVSPALWAEVCQAAKAVGPDGHLLWTC